jgi:hypothetical protein
VRVALVLCPQWDLRFAPLAPALLTAALKERGHEAEFFDLNQEMTLLARAAGDPDFEQAPTFESRWSDPAFVHERVLPGYRESLEAAAARLLAGGTRVVGFSVFFSNRVLSLELAAMLKRREPGVRVVFGGPSCVRLEEAASCLRTGFVDAVFLGEADRSFPDFVDALARTGKPEGALGVLLAGESARWAPGGESVADLDALPFADFSGHRLGRYDGRTIHLSRGCINRCAFCVTGRGEGYRCRSGARVAEELEGLLAGGGGATFFFCDSILNGSLRELEAFRAGVRGRRLEPLWGGYAAARREMTPELLSGLREAGCRFLLYGVESGSAKVLREMGKPAAPELNARVLRDTAAAGIQSVVTLMVGFPSETEEDFGETLSFVRANARSIGMLAPSLFAVDELVDRGGDWGLVPGGDFVRWSTRDGRNAFETRVSRLERLFAAAAACGVRIDFEARVGAAGMQSLFERGL